MKIGDKFIAEKFEGILTCSFVYSMNNYIGEQCEVIELRDYKACVRFENGEIWEWLKSALKPIKGFYVGQKVYSHLFPTDDCSGTIKLIYDNGDDNDVQIYIGDKVFNFSKDGRYRLHGGVCLFSEPIERPKPKFEFGELVLVSDDGENWYPRYFKEGNTVFSAYNKVKELVEEQIWKFIKKYE